MHRGDWRYWLLRILELLGPLLALVFTAFITAKMHGDDPIASLRHWWATHRPPDTNWGHLEWLHRRVELGILGGENDGGKPTADSAI
jgi:hypothetical protein